MFRHYELAKFGASHRAYWLAQSLQNHCSSSRSIGLCVHGFDTAAVLDAVQAAQHLSFWSEEVVRGKLMPLLMQWDMCHPRAVSCRLRCLASLLCLHLSETLLVIPAHPSGHLLFCRPCILSAKAKLTLQSNRVQQALIQSQTYMSKVDCESLQARLCTLEWFTTC